MVVDKVINLGVFFLRGSVMSNTTRRFPFALCLLGAIPIAAVGGCGLFVPEKNMVSPDHIVDPEKGISSEGRYENTLVTHLVCEIASGIWDATANPYFYVPWLKSHDWGTSVTLTITVEDQSGLNPGLALATPLENSIKFFPVGGNVTSSQSFSLGLGGSGAAAATRTETIQFTYENDKLWAFAKSNAQDGRMSCEKYQQGVIVESDLKIRQFIYDKAVVASFNNVTSSKNGYPPFNTFTENLSFVASLGGSVTPTWKFARVSVNPSGTFLSATRTNTNQLTITIGPIQSYASLKGPAQLSTGAQNQHNVQLQAGANAQQSH
jgi:hypothetical protein